MKAQQGGLLRKYDYKTGKKYKQVDLDSIFGEGITFLNDKLYQLRQEKQALSIMLLH
jgi:glutamine cyclotransferase